MYFLTSQKADVNNVKSIEHCFFPTGKLLSRANKIAYFLLNKIGGKEPILKPGDRVSPTLFFSFLFREGVKV